MGKDNALRLMTQRDSAVKAIMAEVVDSVFREDCYVGDVKRDYTT
jgi:hypothetical protein